MNIATVINNNNLFLTASNDSTIKIWDTEINSHLAILKSTDE